jgi:hypothetical protein
MHSNANARVSNELPHVLGVNATSGGLLKATLGAAIVASGILTFAWLPAEYGIDPTGVGHLLGLTEMGHIKESLHADEVNYTLAPGEGIEVKLVMDEGAVTDFEWSANGALLNHDTHGDGSEQNISYEKGRSVPGQTGQLTAAFSGNHGWFWRNRTNDPVVVTLRTRGAYTVMVLP